MTLTTNPELQKTSTQKEIAPLELRPGEVPKHLTFLTPYMSPDIVLESMQSHIASLVVNGRQDLAEEIVADASLDLREQGKYSDLIASMREELAHSPSTLYDTIIPLYTAGKDYLEYRLTLGLLEPALEVALSQTLPEHTDVRTARIVTAISMVRDWVDENTDPSILPNSRIRSFMHDEVKFFLRRNFTAQYARAGDPSQVARKFFDASSHIAAELPADDELRYFDVSDFSLQARHATAKRGRSSGGVVFLATADQIDAMYRRRPSRDTVRRDLQPSVLTPFNHTDVEVNEAEVRHRAIRQTIRLAFEGVARWPKEHEMPSKEDRLLPGGELSGRTYAALATLTLHSVMQEGDESKLVTIVDRAKGMVARRKLTADDLDILRQNIARLLDEYDVRSIPFDAYLIKATESYVSRYGADPNFRDLMNWGT